MFYKLMFDMDRIDDAIKESTNTIYAQQSNLNEFETKEFKKGYYRYVVEQGQNVDNWPNVKFYYSSKASNLENEYLINIVTWPIVHKKVQEEFEQNKIEGIQYLPIDLVDVVTGKVNRNYVVMNILNFINVYDMEASNYTYKEKYDLYSFLPHEIVLNRLVCSQYDIFRCKQNKMPIYISEKIKDIIEKNKWVGFDFQAQKTN